MPLDSGPSTFDVEAGSRLWTLDARLQRRRIIPVGVFALLFFACVFGSWAWFNTNWGARPLVTPKPGEGGSTLDAGPRIWLEARTNIPGYIFVPEPVSDEVMKTLGTTNILSGTFYKIGDRNPGIGISEDHFNVQRSTLDAGHSRLNDQLPTPNSQLPRERVSVFLASWPAGDNTGLTAIQHTLDIFWGGSGWKPLKLGQPQQLIIHVPTFRPAHQKPARPARQLLSVEI